MLKVSDLDDSQIGQIKGNGIQKMIDRKVDKTDFIELINKKTNKNDTQMVINSINSLHK